MSEFKLKGVTSLDLKVGDKVEAEVEGLDEAKVLLVNAAGTIQAIGPKCTHYGAPLVKGVLTANGRITCPWHGGMSFQAFLIFCFFFLFFSLFFPFLSLPFNLFLFLVR